MALGKTNDEGRTLSALGILFGSVIDLGEAARPGFVPTGLAQLYNPSDDSDSPWRWWYRSPISRRISSIIRYHRLVFCRTEHLGLGLTISKEISLLSSSLAQYLTYYGLLLILLLIRGMS